MAVPRSDRTVLARPPVDRRTEAGARARHRQPPPGGPPTSSPADGGVTWLASDVRVNTHAPSVGRISSPQVIASDTSVTVGWLDVGAVFTPTYNRSLDAGISWLSNDRLLPSVPGQSTNAFFLFFAGSGPDVYAVWQDSRSGSNDIYFTIPFGLQSYGVGRAGSGTFVPELAGTGPATIGSTFNLDVGDALGGAAAALVVGGAKASTPILGGTVLVAPALAPAVLLGGTAGVSGAGTLALPLTLPNDEAFVGGALFFQFLILDGGATQGVSMTNGVELWIG